MSTKKTKKNEKKYFCNICDFNTCKITDLNRHNSTQKHIRNKLATDSNTNLDKIQYICEKCSKEYNDRTGLWRHKKVCKENNINENICELDKDDVIITLLKQNAELIKGQQDMMIKLTENGITNNSHNTTTNSTNNSFNLQFFLNETCKNAMNITDFVDSIKLQLNDLISVGELGYVEGISNIIVKKLNALDVTERPVHCTDKKRETIYIKDEDKWEKDENDKKIRKLIKNIAYKNQKLFTEFKEKYPDYNDSNSKHSDQYSKIVIESLADNDLQKEDKIIKNISKVITIDKIK
jgi:hypothetical protein